MITVMEKRIKIEITRYTRCIDKKKVVFTIYINFILFKQYVHNKTIYFEICNDINVNGMICSLLFLIIIVKYFGQWFKF